MKHRYLTYIVLSAVFAIWYWYIPSWIHSFPAIPNDWWWLPYAVWLLPALGAAVYEAHVTNDATQSALSLTTFWAISILVYYVYYWLVAVLPVDGNEWLKQSIGFFYGAILPKILIWELISLVGGLSIGYTIGRVVIWWKAASQQSKSSSSGTE